MWAENVKSLFQEKLPGTQVEVEGEGCNLQLGLISDKLADQSPVKRQQQIHTHLNAWIADSSIHAVTMKPFSHTAWAEHSRACGGSLQWIN